MAKKSKNQPEAVYEGLTFKQFRNVGKSGIELSDVAWAGRLIPKLPHIWSVLVKFITVLCALTVLSLLVVWVSILTRPPALLMAVYPNSQVVCFPRLIDNKGQRVTLDKRYVGLCDTLNTRSGKMWQTQNSDEKSDTSAVGDIKAEVQYKQIKDLPQFDFNQQAAPVDPTIPGGL